MAISSRVTRKDEGPPAPARAFALQTARSAEHGLEACRRLVVPHLRARRLRARLLDGPAARKYPPAAAAKSAPRPRRGREAAPAACRAPPQLRSGRLGRGTGSARAAQGRCRPKSDVPGGISQARRRGPGARPLRRCAALPCRLLAAPIRHRRRFWSAKYFIQFFGLGNPMGAPHPVVVL